MHIPSSKVNFTDFIDWCKNKLSLSFNIFIVIGINLIDNLPQDKTAKTLDNPSHVPWKRKLYSSSGVEMILFITWDTGRKKVDLKWFNSHILN